MSTTTTTSPPTRPRRERPKPVRLSDAAAARIREIIANADGQYQGVRVGVTNGGCAGMSYTMDYADAAGPRDERIYFRTDEESRAAYTGEGGKAFTFDKSGELIVTSYYTIPDRLYDEPDELVRWARRAREAALKAPSAVKRREKNARKAVKT